jgi:hypothetical protein
VTGTLHNFELCKVTSQALGDFLCSLHRHNRIKLTYAYQGRAYNLAQFSYDVKVSH